MSDCVSVQRQVYTTNTYVTTNLLASVFLHEELSDAHLKVVVRKVALIA